MPILPWRNSFAQSSEAVNLERSLAPELIQSPERSKSTAYTDVKRRRITLNVSQPPLKCALSYAYELKNFENSEKFLEIIKRAKEKKINKATFIRDIIRLEAEAIYFRCKVFYEIGVNKDDFPCRQVYLDMYSSSRDAPEADVVKQIASYIKDNGIVRREYAAKQYYADSYDFYTGSKTWPRHYDEQRSQSVVIAADLKKTLTEFRLEGEDSSDEKENKSSDPNIGSNT